MKSTKNKDTSPFNFNWLTADHRPIILKVPGTNAALLIYNLIEFKGQKLDDRIGLYQFYYDKYGQMKPKFGHPPLIMLKDFALTVANELRRYLGASGVTEAAVAERVETSAQQKEEDEIERLSKLVPF